MEDAATPVAPEAEAASGDHRFHPRRWPAELRRSRERETSFGFGARLFAAVVVTIGLIGATGYVLLERNLAQQQITHYAAAQRADARSFEEVAARAATPAQAIRRIDGFLDIVQKRPGTKEVVLVNPQQIVVASGIDSLEGTRDDAPRIDAALDRGTPYAGRQSDLKEDRRDFEFVAPVNFPGLGRYAYAVAYDHRAYDAQLNEVRKVLLLVGLLALFGGGGVFYLVGGRRLMRAYRMVLRRATRDGLTDLPNQRAFQDELPQAVAAAERYGDALSLALLDVDDFKSINDRHGHPHGDRILKLLAQLLAQSRPGDRPYRVGGDEFALLLAHTDADGAGILARRLCRKLEEAAIKVSVGVSTQRPGMHADTLRAEADAALYEAKRRGGNRAANFAELEDPVVVDTAEKKEAVRRLLEEKRLTIDFQPIWNIDAETLLGVEALARPDRSYALSGPAEAFDIAEQSGRVHQLDELCATRALSVAGELGPDVLLFINLSPATLDLDADGDDWFAAAVEHAELSPQRVVVEVTERFGGRVESVVRSLRRLREQGFQIAIDDVGTGNSGLEMLSKINAQFVKLDRSIVSAAATEPGARAVLLAMATFARQTGALVIAEGIEDEETLQFLRTVDHALGTDPIIQGGQGFGLGRPSQQIPSRLPDILRSGHAAVQRTSEALTRAGASV
jgi:diguanylate cyclase (GGDEF)-like protein